VAKWHIFNAAVKADEPALAIVGVLTSVVSVFFYLRIVVMMYMTPGDGRPTMPAIPRIAAAALIVSAGMVLYLGILPSRVLDWAAASISTIF
jgi:NADH-quinone oxidoreductase subunit N